MMHIEVDNCDALGPVFLLRMTRGNRDVVEQAETHRTLRFGMMAGRPGGDEGVRCLLSHDLVDRVDGTTGCPQCGLEAARRHRGVGIDPDHALLWRRVANTR